MTSWWHPQSEIIWRNIKPWNSLSLESFSTPSQSNVYSFKNSVFSFLSFYIFSIKIINISHATREVCETKLNFSQIIILEFKICVIRSKHGISWRGIKMMKLMILNHNTRLTCHLYLSTQIRRTFWGFREECRSHSSSDKIIKCSFRIKSLFLIRCWEARMNSFLKEGFKKILKIGIFQ